MTEMSGLNVYPAVSELYRMARKQVHNWT